MASGSKQKEEKPKRRRMGGFGRYAYGYVMRPIRLTIILFILRGIGILICLIAVLFLLSGGINQVKTGESLAEYALDIGEDISEFFMSLADGTGPFKFTEDGIYFKDAEVPENGALDGNENLIDDDSKLEEWKENHRIDDISPEGGGSDGQ